MAGKLVGIFVLTCAALAMLHSECGSNAMPQRAAYSLQAAVDELHRRELAKYPLNVPPLATSADWDEDINLFEKNSNKNTNWKHHKINQALAKYLKQKNHKSDHVGLSLGSFDVKQQTNSNNFDNSLGKNLYKMKRSSPFRERDEPYENGTTMPLTSVFRERENLGTGDAHSELTEQFLREIENAGEQDQQERYKAALRQLWENYQQQENELEDGEPMKQEKRMRMPPYYLLMQKKRSYPMLPWLPYDAGKSKRFPVAKRAAKRSASESASIPAPVGTTDEKVVEELSELFGKSDDQEKKKRSIDEPAKMSSTTHLPDTTAEAMGEMRLEIKFQPMNLTNLANEEGGVDMQYRHRKRNDHGHAHQSGEESDEHDEHDEHVDHEEHDEEGEENTEEDDHDEFDEDEELEMDAEERRKKKKRAATPSVGHLMLRAKKSIDWSQYFGLDRKKKSDPQAEADVKKRSTNENNNDDADKKKKKRDVDPDKLESMDKKLKAIEDYIIDDTIKYTGAHEGISNRNEIRKLKDHVLSRLATAYSVEKMRRAIEKMRQSVDNDNHLLRNMIEPESEENTLDSNWPYRNGYGFGAKKQLAEGYMPKSNDDDDDDDDDVDGKKKKKRSGYLRFPEQPNAIEEALTNLPYESLNDAYLGNKNYIIGSNQCPMIESIAERCRGIDLMSGDVNQELLPLCGVHQICYLCGTSQVACDYQYLAEAEGVCGDNNECEAAARSVLMVLRGTSEPVRQMGPRECLKNPCLYSAMREIGL